MAAVTHVIATASTSNVATYPTGSFTPTAGDLLVFMSAVGATLDAGAATASNNGITFGTEITHAVRGGIDTQYAYVAGQLVPSSPTAMTCTMDVTGDNGTGAVDFVAAISGMSKVNSAAIRQSGTNNGAAGTTPSVTLGSAILTTNPVIAFMQNVANPAGVTPPANFTELSDTGYATPDKGAEYAHRDSGETGTTITWGASSATAWSAIVIEFDASASGTNWTQTPTDAAGLVDTTAIDRGEVADDPAGLVDTQAIARDTVLDDATGLTDSATVGLVKDVAADDPTGMVDSTTVSRGYGVETTDAAGATDATAVDRGLVVQDAAGTADTTALDRGSVAAENAGLTDSATVENGKLVGQTDATGLTDAVVLDLFQTITESVGLADLAALTQDKTTTDTTGLTDSTVIDKAITITSTDSVGLSDATAFVLDAVRDVVDSAGLSDAFAQQFGPARTDTTGLTDGVLVEVGGVPPPDLRNARCVYTTPEATVTVTTASPRTIVSTAEPEVEIT